MNTVEALSIVEGEAVTVRARLQNQETLDALVQADIDEIWLRVFSLDDGEKVWEDSLEIEDHVFNEMQTGGWIGLESYNFSDTQPSDDWMNKVEGGKRYRLQYEFRLMDGRLIRRSVIVPIEEWLDG